MTPAARGMPPLDDEIQWIFSWRRRTSRIAPALLPVTLAAVAFGVLLAVVQVKVASPQFEMERQGSLIYLPASGDGLAWAIRASEAGPSLTRFEPAAWNGYPPLDQAVIAATRVPALPRVPQLHPLPAAGGVAPLTLASAGVPVFPTRPAAAAPAKPPVAVKLRPVLYPLSAAGSSALPETLPPFSGPIDPAITAVEWRFILRLYPTGGVAECLSLTQPAGPGAAGAGRLENWLRGVAFDPVLAAKSEWIAVGIRFNNDAADGTDNH